MLYQLPDLFYEREEGFSGTGNTIVVPVFHDRITCIRMVGIYKDKRPGWRGESVGVEIVPDHTGVRPYPPEDFTIPDHKSVISSR